VNEKVTKLHAVKGDLRTTMDPLTIIGRYEKFINDELLELDTLDYLTEIEADLEVARPAEILLGPLSNYERRLFALATLVEASIHDVLQQYETAAAETVAKRMRDERIGLVHALQSQLQYISPDLRIDLNRRALTHSTLMSGFDWSVRTRYDEWSNYLVVRKNYTVHSYG